MQDALGAAPFRQHPDQRTGCERVLAIPGWQQRNPYALACCRYQDVKAAAGKARLDRHTADFTIFGRQVPNAAALLFLLQDREAGKVRWGHRNTRLRQQVRACDQDAPTYPDLLHLQVGVGIETLTNADRDIDPVVNEVDPAIGGDALKAQSRVGGKETRQGIGDGALKSERAAQSNKPPRFALPAKRGFLGGLSLDHRRARMFEDLLADLGQAEASRGSIEQPHSEPLLQQSDAPADA